MSFTNTHEETWNTTIEEYLSQVRQSCKEHSKLNNDSGYHFKRLKVRYGLPAVMIPVIMSPISLMVGWATEDSCDKITAADYLNTMGFLLAATFSGISQYFDYGERTRDHFNVSLLFDGVISDIELELTKARIFRIQADVFLCKISQRVAEALRIEPIIPGTVLQKNNTTTLEIKEREADLSAVSQTETEAETHEVLIHD